MSAEKEKPKTIQQIFDGYKISLGHDYDNSLDLKKVIHDILRTLSEKKELPEHEAQTMEQHKEMYQNDKLWEKIMKIANEEGKGNFIGLAPLRRILEDFKILGDEKNGM